jgi:hypothetical protein
MSMSCIIKNVYEALQCPFDHTSIHFCMFTWSFNIILTCFYSFSLYCTNKLFIELEICIANFIMKTISIINRILCLSSCHIYIMGEHTCLLFIIMSHMIIHSYLCHLSQYKCYNESLLIILNKQISPLIALSFNSPKPT